jgi:GMP synthase (glutamine-hydrolysing)
VTNLPQKQAFILQHVGFEDFGSFEPVLRQHGFHVRYIEAGIEDLHELHASEPDLLVVLGAPIGAYDESVYPFLRDETRLLEERLSCDLPVMGICLGAQLMAKALGARVYPGPQKEIGWKPLSLTPEAATTAVRHLDPHATSMFHWHGDTFDLPSGARLLASTDICANQIFSWGKNAIAFQCHPELSPPTVERWLVGHACELAMNSVSPNRIREDTRRLGPALQEQGTRLMRELIQGWM